MPRLAPFDRICTLALLTVTLVTGVALSGCRKNPEGAPSPSASPRAPRDARERSEAEGLEAVAENASEIRRRAMFADIEVPGTEERVRLVDGKGRAAGSPPAWSVEARSVAGVVRGSKGLDVFVDLALQRPGKPAEGYVILLYMDSLEAVYTSAALIGEGTKVVSVKAENPRGDVYDLAVDYVDEANPSATKKKTVVVAHHALGGHVVSPVSPH